MRRWNVIVTVGTDGEQVFLISRGVSLRAARNLIFENYRGVRSIVHIEERLVEKSYPVSMEALKAESNIIPRLAIFN